MSQHAVPSNDESRPTVVVGCELPCDAFVLTAVENEDVIAWLWRLWDARQPAPPPARRDADTFAVQGPSERGSCKSQTKVTL